MRISDLTRGEKLFLARRRDKKKMTEAAEAHGVSLHQYRKWESDEGKGPDVALGRLTLTDQFLILRRRSGKTVREIAAEIGCCPWWLRLMEREEAPNDRLKKYWNLAS